MLPPAKPSDSDFADQRQRLVLAIAATLAEHGYAALTVEKVLGAAGVSRATFDEHFADKDEAVEVAQEVVFARFRERLLLACAAQAQWPFKVKVAIGATLDFAAAAPDQAQLLVLDARASDLAVARRSMEARDNLAALLASGRRYREGCADLPSLTEQTLIAGLAGAISIRLLRGEAKHLPELAPQLVQFALLPYLGRAEAARVASRPRPGMTQ